MGDQSGSLFQFPALPAGPPSRGNWYQELLDDVECRGNPIKVQEAYESHRRTALAKSYSTFEAEKCSAFRADATLDAYLAGQLPHTEQEDVNCLVFWARPAQGIQALIGELQRRLSFLGDGVYQVPLDHLHLSVLELSHRHPVQHLRSVERAVGSRILQDMVDLPSAVAKEHGSRIKLGLPQLSFDKAGIALSFVPIPDPGNPGAPSFSYHNLRSELHKTALGSGIEIDTCYTAATAHVAFARFKDAEFWKNIRDESGRTAAGSSPADELLDFVRSTNQALCRPRADNEFGPECGFDWVVAGSNGLEIQLGYVKYGRGTDAAAIIGRSVDDTTRNAPEKGFWRGLLGLVGLS